MVHGRRRRRRLDHGRLGGPVSIWDWLIIAIAIAVAVVALIATGRT
jgi:hypothetical protein